MLVNLMVIIILQDTCLKSSCCTPNAYRILHVNYILIKLEKITLVISFKNIANMEIYTKRHSFSLKGKTDISGHTKMPEFIGIL